MPVHFTNPAALWALLALPVIILIHCLQERSRRLRISTMFLLERVAPESVSGARLERLRTSLPFWLQLLAALGIAWILAGPRWAKKDSTQTVVVILDSSASMSAFKEETKAALDRTLGRWAQNAAKTRWHLIETDVRKPTLYAGTHLDELLAATDQWRPAKGSHSPADAYMVGRSLVKNGGGLVLHVTNHKMDVPPDIALLAVGEPKDNVGFSGLTTRVEDGHLKWRVLVTNHGASVQSRNWWLERRQEGQPMKARLELQPGQSLSLEGELPPEVNAATLKLDPDVFTMDDTLPMIRPVERGVHVEAQGKGPSADRLHKMIEAIPGVLFTTEKPDITLAEVGSEVATDAIFYDSPAPDDAKLDATFVVAENHALTRELNWMGLLTQKPTKLALVETDTPLLWKGDAILAFLRHTTNADARPVRQLFLNWDLARSNAYRLPAMLVMLQRLVDARRESLEGERTGNYEAGESIALPPGGGLRQITMNGRTEAFTGHAPDEAGFFEVTLENKAQVHGACHFADAREADLRGCNSADTTEMRRLEVVLRSTEADPLTPLWLLGVLGCLLGAWGAGGRRETRSTAG
ncbi:MAG: hypothetical protein JWO94_1630 [Verrucomicrobiaceae bacterium]|nr:hypothetical protein [Verrucomicrobiaceae bacterium]